MRVSRGDFLKLCATALVGVGADVRTSLAGDLLIGDAASDSRPSNPAARFDWAHASAALFEPHVDSTFRARGDDGKDEPLRLARVIRLPFTPGVEQFSLVFHARSSPALQGIHTLRHATLGEFAVYIAPVGAAQDPHACEACFSRLTGRQ